MRIARVSKAMDYVFVYQNAAINSFAYITNGLFRDGDDSKRHINSNGEIDISRDNTKFVFNQSALSLSGRTHQFLMFLIEKFANVVYPKASPSEVLKNCSIRLLYAEIADEFNLSTTAAKAMAIQSAQMLKNTVINTAWRVGQKEKYESVGIVSDVNEFVDPSSRKGGITVVFDTDFAERLPFMGLMLYPRKLRKIVLRRFPNANAFGIRLTTNWNINYGKHNQDWVNVLLMLNSTQAIPRYDDLDKKYRQVQKRIIQPFIRDLNVLVGNNILSEWHFEYENNVIPEEQHNKMSYELFSKCKVVYKMANYPDEIRRKNYLAKSIKPQKVQRSQYKSSRLKK